MYPEEKQKIPYTQRIQDVLGEAQFVELAHKISKALGPEKLQTLSVRQAAHLNQSFKRILNRKSVEQISDEEIVGAYEIITQHVSPLAYEVHRRQWDS